jgi:hypothetical protein
MSGIATKVVRRWRVLALPIVVVAGVAGMALVAGAEDDSEAAPSGAVTDAGVNPWEANDPEVLAGVDTPAGVVSEFGKGEIEWTQTGIGSIITQADGSMFAVASVENSVDGPGAVVSEITLNGTSGTQAATRYNANGVFVGDEEFTLGTANADGTIPFTGSGECVKGGTRAHKNEKCSYTLSGTLDPTTNTVHFEVTGTSTR